MPACGWREPVVVWLINLVRQLQPGRAATRWAEPHDKRRSERTFEPPRLLLWSADLMADACTVGYIVAAGCYCVVPAHTIQ